VLESLHRLQVQTSRWYTFVEVRRVLKDLVNYIFFKIAVQKILSAQRMPFVAVNVVIVSCTRRGQIEVNLQNFCDLSR